MRGLKRCLKFDKKNPRWADRPSPTARNAMLEPFWEQKGVTARVEKKSFVDCGLMEGY